MNQQFQSLIEGYLDGELSTEQLAELNKQVASDPECAKRFAEALLLHDRLQVEIKTGALATTTKVAVARQRPVRVPFGRWTLTGVAAALLVAVATVLWHNATVSSASAAVVALDRIIEAARLSVDRVYEIRVIDFGPDGGGQPVHSDTRGQKPGINGAKLFVRGTDQFLLIRKFGDGTEFLTGSDGVIGWSAPPTGHVHLSRDIRRFRRGVPGEREEVPFLDLQAGLAELKRSYDLSLSASGEDSLTPAREHQLVAIRHVGRKPGPQQVRIWFDENGLAHRIELSGLPPGELKAASVELRLVEQRDLGPDFFKHESHHDAGRPIDWE